MQHLFNSFPVLMYKIPYKKIGELPSPCLRAEQLEKDLSLNSLYIKDDGKSSKIYGGNKVRKLEVLLGEAQKQGAKRLITFGGAGSNHALATTIHTKNLGIKSTLLLSSQPNSKKVRENLLQMLKNGAEIEHVNYGPQLILRRTYKVLEQLKMFGEIPYIIPPGGTTAASVSAFINAAFELKEQILKQDIPEPDMIYISFGTMGSAVGLALGLCAAGIKSKVIAVRVVDERFKNATKAKELAKEAMKYIQSHSPSFPDCGLDNLQVRGEFYGGGYGVYSQETKAAVDMFNAGSGVEIEQCYTAKCFAALLADSLSGELSGKDVLFWNTYNNAPLPQADEHLYSKLPVEFQSFFKNHSDSKFDV